MIEHDDTLAEPHEERLRAVHDWVCETPHPGTG